MTTENTIIIFHRPKQNAEESLAHQQAFLEPYRKEAKPYTVIDYVTGDRYKAEQVSEIISKQPQGKIIIVINSFLPAEEFHRQYDLYSFFKYLKTISMADLYLIDSEGKLYKQSD